MNVQCPDEPTTAAAHQLREVSDLYALLARCFERPDGEFHAAVDVGAFEQLLSRKAAILDVYVDPTPPVGDLGSLRRSYRRSFEAYDGKYAPPVESVYERWHDGEYRELLSGPAAVDMRRRYEKLDVQIPDAYPADHLALLLEYGSLLLEAGELEEFEQYHTEHFDWIPKFHARVEKTCEEPFYRWATEVLSATIEEVATRLDEEH